MASSDEQVLPTQELEALDVVVETPTSPSSGLARSRFEFETGRGNEGTKILMVEWEAAALKKGASSAVGESSDGASDGTGTEADKDGGWDVSWEAKGDVLPVRDAELDPTSSSIRRVYFLLPPGAPIPALVSITRGGGGGVPVLRTKPMPAIFPAGLTGQPDAGRRGVLHTIWAKRRLAELQSEIEVEMRANGEGVGLEMAMQERQWLIDHFGLEPDPGMPPLTKLHIPQTSAGPASPRSPVGGRLGEKLRGLKLATSPAELAAASQASKSAQPPRTQPSITSISPPSTSGASAAGGVASLDAIVGSGSAPGTTPAASQPDDAQEEDLFALPMSPRSPEMKRSPFSLL